jgi:hypothetical protein
MSISLKADRAIEWARPTGCPDGFQTRQVFAGRADPVGGSPIEIALARWTKADRVSREALTRLHALRVNKRATPVVLAVELDDGSVITFGPNPAAAPLQPLPAEQAQRVFQAVLDEPTALLARARLAALSQAIDSTTIPGVKNSGLFANHELRVGVPQRTDWAEACARSAGMLADLGPALIGKLGYTVQRAGAHALVLTGAGPRPQAIAVMLDEREAFDAESPRFTISPVAYGIKMAEQQGVSWLIMLRGTQVRLYPTRVELGVGRKGLSETFLEVDLPQLTASNAGYLSLIFSSEALADGGSTYSIMEASTQYAVALGARLRDKVYEEVIPELSLAVAVALMEQGREMDAEGLDLAYQVTLRIFFRLLFQVYAEDRKLLPYGDNPRYDRNALKTVAKDLTDDPDQAFDEASTSLWDDLAQVWRVIDAGDKAWGVPPYNGGLFTSDPEMNEHGSIIGSIRITNDVMGPVLRALLLDEAEDGSVGPIDFRSLGVREFGTIYEGLLESSLGLAEVDLTLDDKNTWLPAKKGDDVEAFAGQVYFHNTSGQRKGTGSYFTPSFVVEHLLERSLDPALDEHLAKVAALIEAGDQAGAADLFFDFRVADLAMGSGHFLTAAIDHIENKMAAFLAEDGHHIPGVAKELALLHQAAKDAMGPDAPEPEPPSLLRRQIARRCVYGLDINPIAVELARVSIWIHTFVRGLPMSSLDHNLVCANSLTGIGSVEEALDVLVPGRKGNSTLFDAPIEDALNSARTVLVDVGRMAEALPSEAKEATHAARRALAEAETAKLLFDAAVLTRIGRGGLVAGYDPAEIAALAAQPQAQEAVRPLRPAHMPVLFPEVFLRDNGGFDVLVGNPPWEKLKVEEHQWWGLRFPGLRSMPMAKRTQEIASLRKNRPDLVVELDSDIELAKAARAVVSAGPFPGIGSGDIDLYKAFAWRNWQLIGRRGLLGMVLPRAALSGSGTEQWRRTILANGAFSDVVITVNSGHWVFASVDARYTTAFVVAERGSHGRIARFAGPFHSREEFERGRTDLAAVGVTEFESWTATAAFPLIPSRASGEVFRQMRLAPALSDDAGFEFRPAAELHATQDSSQFSTTVDTPISSTPVLTGSSFNLWNPDFGSPYGFAKPTAARHILDKTLRSANQARSAFHGLRIQRTADLPMSRARVVFRDICRSNDSRTVITCLVPPGVMLVHPAPYLVRRKGSASDEAFLLAVMSSIPFDWYARRIVELHLTFELLQHFPVPRVDPEEGPRRRAVELAGRLAARNERFADWAAEVGVPVGSITTPDTQADAEAELDALVSHLYGLSRDQVVHVFETFHRGWDYRPRLTAVLAHYDRIGAS